MWGSSILASITDTVFLFLGYYVYAEGSVPAAFGDKARLVSSGINGSVFQPTSRRYIQFWYHMYGSSIGALRVFIKDSETSVENMIFQVGGNKGNVWKFANLTIVSSNPYQVIFLYVFFSDFVNSG